MANLVGVDPKGAGKNEQKVNAKGQALVAATSSTDFEDSSEDGKAFNWSSGIIDIDATDTVLLIKNTSNSPLKIESVSMWNGSVASQYQIHLPTTEVTPTGTVVAATVLNTGKVGSPDVTAKSDETNNSQGAVLFTPMLAVDSNLTINTVGLTLAKNKSIAVDVVEDTSESGVTIRAHY